MLPATRISKQAECRPGVVEPHEIETERRRTKLWFTGKRSSADEDTEAEIQVEEGAGLLALAGTAPVAGETA